MRLALSLLVILSLLLVGCTGEQQDNLDYMIGTQGIEITFVDDGLNEIYESSPYTLSTEVKNKGVFDEPYGKVVLRGFDPSIMPFKNMANGLVVEGIPKIDPKSAYNPEGGFELIDFNVPKNEIYIPYGESYNPSLVASSCYYYETVAAPTVCIVPDLMTYQKQKFCTADTIYMQSQGAPVAVTKVDENIMENYVNFVITIENVGGGKVLKRSQEVYNRCPNAIQYSDLNEVQFDANIPGLPAPKCSPDGKVKLIDGKGTFTCKFQIMPEYDNQYSLEYNKESFTKQMKIMLQYFYTKDIYKNLNVLRIPGRTGETTIVTGNDPLGDTRVITPVFEPEPTYDDLSCTCQAHNDDHDLINIRRPMTTKPGEGGPCICIYHIPENGGSPDNVYCKVDGSADKEFDNAQNDFVLIPSDKENFKNCKMGEKDVSCMQKFSYSVNGKVKIKAFSKKESVSDVSQECNLVVKQ